MSERRAATKQAVLPYPAGMAQALKLSEHEFERELLFLAAAKLYELGRLSSGKAASLAGMARVAFLRELARIGVPAGLAESLRQGKDALAAGVEERLAKAWKGADVPPPYRPAEKAP